MGRYFVGISCVLALFPFVAFAEGEKLPAGFAPNSVWVSSAHIAAGDSVNIFTVVYNSSDVPLTGDVNFMVDEKSIGVKNFSIKAGETEIASISWNATFGSHSVYARIEKISDTDTSAGASVLNRTTDTITLTVSPTPPPSQSTQTINTIKNLISSSTKSATPVVQNVIATLEIMRQSAIDALESRLATSSPRQNQALGASPADTATSSEAAIGTLSTIWLTVIGALLVIFRIQWLFYLALLLVTYILYKVIRAVFSERRP